MMLAVGVVIINFILPILVVSSNKRLISIRGHASAQSLPKNLASSWKVWTFDTESRSLTSVESESENEWVNPNSFEELFLPQDLPLPLSKPALGVALSYGVARYIMPSVVLTLETPAQIWRNRGLKSLPRANAWIDLFAPYTPKLDALKLTCYGQSTENLRFLEDQDGTGAWECLLEKTSRTLLAPSNGVELGVSEAYEAFQSYLKSINANDVFNGYHFVDIPIPKAEPIQLPRIRLKSFLSDFSDPSRLLEIEDPSVLDSEPCGVLDIKISVVGSGADSQFLPEVSYVTPTQ